MPLVARLSPVPLVARGGFVPLVVRLSLVPLVVRGSFVPLVVRLHTLAHTALRQCLVPLVL